MRPLDALALGRGQLAGLLRSAHVRHRHGGGVFQVRRLAGSRRKLLLPAVFRLEVVVRVRAFRAGCGCTGGICLFRERFLLRARKRRRLGLLTLGALAIRAIAFVAEGFVIDAGLEILGVA